MSGSERRMHGLIRDLEGGYVVRIAFVVPREATWPLPVYELALMTAARAYELCLRVELTLVTAEPAPLAVFGEQVSRDVAALLSNAGIAVETGTDVVQPAPNVLELGPGGQSLAVDRVVTVPVLDGPAIEGLPCDDAGFLATDAFGRVADAPGVYAAGDATTFAIKQGGLACQQADAAAEAIAAEAGAPITPSPYEPVLRGLLLTEYNSLWMQRNLHDGSPAEFTDFAWAKFAGRELSRLLRPPIR
jgi:sulfide:quinone oxidoreductase